MRALLSWSGGKDSALALAALRQRSDLEVVGLLTTVSGGRVTMHGVAAEVLEAQARAVGLSLWPVELPHPCDNARYAAIMGEVCARARAEGIEAIAFGDLFLEDIRRYREENVAKAGLEAIFPIWTTAEATAALAREAVEMVDARVVCIDPKVMPPSALGAAYDHAFLDALPEGVDAMGERGEFHTLVVGGAIFAEPLSCAVGPPVAERDGFLFASASLTPRRRR